MPVYAKVRPKLIEAVFYWNPAKKKKVKWTTSDLLGFNKSNSTRNNTNQ